MPIKKNKPYKKYIILLVIIAIIALMIISFPPVQQMTETVLFP